MSFKKNKYQVLRGAISKELADVAYRYLQVSAEADNWMINNYVTHVGNPLVGNFHDKHCLLYTSPSPRDQRGSRVPGWG